MSILTEAVVVLAGDATPLNAVMEKAVNSVRDTGRRLEEVGNSLSLRVTLPILGIGAASTIASARFDRSMRQVAALTALPAKHIDSLRDDVRSLGAEFGQGATAAADALFFLAIPSLTAAQNMAILKQSLKAAAIGMGEAKDIALGVVGAMNAYAKSGLTAARATDILAAGTKFGRFEAAELVPQLGRLTGFAAALNISFQDLIGTMAVLTLTGANTAEAATSLSAIMSTLAGTSAEGEKLLAEFGLSMSDLREIAAGPNGLINVLRKLDEATGGNIEQLETIFPNIRALRGAMIALAQDSETVDKALSGVRDSVGLVDDAMEASEGSMLKLKEAMAELENAAISVGDAISPVVIPAIKALTGFLQALGSTLDSLPIGMKAVVLLFIALAAAVGPVLSLAGTLIGLLPGFVLLFYGLRRVGMVMDILATKSTIVASAVTRIRATWVSLATALNLATVRAAATGSAMAGLRVGLAALATTMAPFIITSVLFVAAFGAIVQAGAAVKENWSILRYEGLRLLRNLGLIDEETKALMPDTSALNRILLAMSGTLNQMEPPKELPIWLEDAREASKALFEELRRISIMTDLFGRQFDTLEARVTAYETAVDALASAGVDMDAAVGPNGETLRQLATTLQMLRVELETSTAVENTWTEAIERAKAAVEQSRTPLQELERIAADLSYAFTAGKITWDEYVQALSDAGEATRTFDDMDEKIDALTQGFVDLVTRGIDRFVDSLFEAEMNFKEFVRSMLIELSKLIIKIELLKLIANAEGEFLGVNILGFARGGYLGPGEIGVVGEQGPELVRAGRGGMTVTPNVGSTTQGIDAADGGGINVTVVNNVKAIDSRDVVRFFEENESLVAGSIMRATQRSFALRRRLAGG